MLLLHVCFGWLLSFLDIKDAFLLVPQRELVLVAKPSWWDPMSTSGNERYWVLERCLPGQRNAAARFFDFLMEHFKMLDFVNIPLLPSLFKHKEKNIVVCSHVDDLILGGEQRELAWLVNELEK